MKVDSTVLVNSTHRENSGVYLDLAMGQPRRIIWSCELVTDFLGRILYHEEASSKVIVVCSTREHFLEQLAAAVHYGTTTPEGHGLITKAIGLLSRSQDVKLAFCETLEHLRAYIPVLDVASTKREGNTADESSQRPLLAVLNPLALHLPTTEFSAQGLSRTLAGAVEVTARQDVDLVLCECVDAMENANKEHGEALWNTEVPLLNGTARIGTEESTSRGHSVPMKKVAQRWFEFDDDRNIYRQQQ